MTVDYISALPGELLGGRLRGARARAKIAVTRVEPSSDAWRAGVRPGDAILSVLDSPMTTPEGFYSFTLSMLGQVEIEIVDSEGRKRLVEVRRQM
jgi:S1-C subfamily serine protease